MKNIKHLYFYTKYLFKQNKMAIITFLLYTGIIVIWNAITYSRGLFIQQTEAETAYSVFSASINLIVFTVIAVILYTSDVTDGTIGYIRMRPLSVEIHTFIKLTVITLILLLGILPIYTSSVLIGTYSTIYFLLTILTAINISIISSGVSVILKNNKAAMLTMAAYSGLSTGLHSTLIGGNIASWLKTLSLIAPLYKVLPWVGILLLPLIFLLERRRDIRA